VATRPVEPWHSSLGMAWYGLVMSASLGAMYGRSLFSAVVSHEDGVTGNRRRMNSDIGRSYQVQDGIISLDPTLRIA
jgi:hypothetical protein